ncbi:oligosaccharyl transferase, archaeosortase A system-associated [Halobacteriales archaeon SW_5_68_122]|nr:MAG: oligosaccharyl transferase, archaeosortase A system-associated [Halobacteriales archaeon SW_5_68_122]
MSQRRDQVEERLDEYESQLDSVYRLYHIPVLAAMMLFMLWVRVRHYERMIGENGRPLYRGNDPYYHRRTTEYVIRNYPFNMPYEVWTGFDTGTQVGQFGTIFDQVVATVALVVGLGDPSTETVTLVTVLTPPVIAVLCVPPMFHVGRRLGGRLGGLVGVLIMALTPGAFLFRSVAGFYDHHIAEVLCTLLALVVAMRMLTVAQRDEPIYEFVDTREFGLLKAPVAWGAALGAALALTMLVWPPALFLLGVFAIFLFVQLSLEFVKGHSPDHIAIPSVVASLVAGLLVVPFVTTTELTTTELSILQPLLGVLVAGGAAFMAAVARLWEDRDLSRAGYPVGVAAVGGLAAGVVALVAPETFDFFVRQVRRVAGLGSTDTAATVGEAQSVDNPVRFFFRNYGLAFYTALAGAALIGIRALLAERARAERTLVMVFTVLLVLFTLTQQRFDYYLVVGVAATNAYLVGVVFNFIDIENVRESVTNIEAYQVLVVIAILFVVAGPLVVRPLVFLPGVVDVADGSTDPGEYQDWEDSLEWLSEETPEEGEYAGGSEGTLDYYGDYERTDDFEYSDGEYGVMAWWDYGHYITYGGERVPVANPFQQNADQAADFLLADNESEAERILEEDTGEGSETRYVMIDYKLGYAGTTKYNAPTAFETRHDVDRGDLGLTLAAQRFIRQGRYVPAYAIHNQRDYESMRVRLYQFHGSAREPATIVTRFQEVRGTLVQPNPRGPDGVAPVETYNTSEAAREAARQDPNARHGGIDGRPPERVEALEHYRLVHASEPSSSDRLDEPPFFEAYNVDAQSKVPYVKTFERVEGATVEGTGGPANAEVEVRVQMEMPTVDRTFTYRQFVRTDDQGNFETTVPYSTTGYDEYGTEAGYTNTSVRATGSYQFIAIPENGTDVFIGQADVTEGQVLGENDTAVRVEMQSQASSGNETSDNETSGNETDATGSDTDGDQSGDSGANATNDTTQQRARAA